MGSDKEVESDFTLIAGTNRDLQARVIEGLFREDLLARINIWTFVLPGLANRREDIEPNIDFELLMPIGQETSDNSLRRSPGWPHWLTAAGTTASGLADTDRLRPAVGTLG